MTDKFVMAAGHLLIQGKSPDGDSIRFVPDNLETLTSLPGGDRIRPSTHDGSVQLRLDAIDAPETHYAGRRQPFADAARDELVAFCDFTDVTYDDSGTVTAGDPDQVDAWIVAKLVESHGRPVSYLLPRPRHIDPPPSWSDGQTVDLTPEVLRNTANAHMVSSGRAYVTLYTSTPPELRCYFADLARAANTTDQNVWADDHSRGFDLIDRACVGERGVLILPKLFRRVTDYLTAREKGDAESFVAWLRTATSGGFSENDEVEVCGRRMTLADLIVENGTRIGLDADILDLVFVEK